MKKNLPIWLNYLNNIGLRSMDLARGRVNEVSRRLALKQPIFPVVTVAGTNGKGSTVAVLEAILIAQKIKVATYTSPYLLSFNEQFRLSGKWIDDETLCRFFSMIDEARGDIVLILFEFKLLAMWLWLQQEQPDVALLEVGVGGRLDAVNCIDPTIAVITSISLDHCEWLGDTRELIAKEKVGIFRESSKAVYGEANVPVTVAQAANKLNVDIVYQGKDFSFAENKTAWSWQYKNTQHQNLPVPKVLLQNASTALMVAQLLQSYFPIAEQEIHQGLEAVFIPGRLQKISDTIVFDVAHNQDSVALLGDYLKQQTIVGKTFAVFSILKSKDFDNVISMIKDQIDIWYIAPLLDDARGMKVVDIQKKLQGLGVKEIVICDSISQAFIKAKEDAGLEDFIVAFGSFGVVGDLSKNYHCAPDGAQ
jgi:dihydrofolate synthase / folylpolyglutamate synthase